MVVVVVMVVRVMLGGSRGKHNNSHTVHAAIDSGWTVHLDCGG